MGLPHDHQDVPRDKKSRESLIVEWRAVAANAAARRESSSTQIAWPAPSSVTCLGCAETLPAPLATFKKQKGPSRRLDGSAEKQHDHRLAS